MRLRALLLLLGAAALFGATPARSASSAYPWCTDDRASPDSCYYDSGGRRCWVTVSGLGVCIPIPPTPPRQRRVITEGRR